MAIQLKRGFTSEIDPNYLLAQGQLGVEMPSASNSATVPFRMKIGDGTTVWSKLPYFGEPTNSGGSDIDISGLVPNTRKINSKALTSDITLNAADVGAAATSHTHTRNQITDFPTSMPASDVSSWAKASSKPSYSASEVGAVPTTRTINSHPLNQNISLTASDVGAAAASHTHSGYLSTSGTAAAATKLATARTIRVNLGSTSSSSFDGTANITPGVTGTLGVANGGTGVTSLSELKTALGVNDSAGSYLPLSGGTITGDLTIEGDHLLTVGGDLEVKYGITAPSIGFGENGTYWVGAETGTDGVIVQASSNATIFGTNVIYPYDDNWTSLGKSGNRWKAIWSQSGTIQTSDKSEKHNIQYLSDSSVATLAAIENNSAETISYDDIVEFISNIEPATFEYNTPEGVEQSPEDIQIGLIADDIKDTKLFKYIGCEFDSADAAKLAIQPLPVAVTALAACKYLLSRNAVLEAKIADIEEQLASK